MGSSLGESYERGPRPGPKRSDSVASLSGFVAQGEMTIPSAPLPPPDSASSASTVYSRIDGLTTTFAFRRTLSASNSLLAFLRLRLVLRPFSLFRLFPSLFDSRLVRPSELVVVGGLLAQGSRGLNKQDSAAWADDDTPPRAK